MPISQRIRQIYQTETLFVGPTGSFHPTGQHFTSAVYGQPLNGTGAPNTTGNLIAQLYRIQKCDYDWNKTLKDVNQFGELAYIDRVPIDQPTVTLSTSWVLSNFINESRIGLTVSASGASSQTSCISGILAGAINGTDGINIFALNTNEGTDANYQNGTGFTTVAVGNAFLNTYSLTAKVNDFPMAECTFDAINIQVDPTNSGAAIPAVTPQNGLQITGWTYALPNPTSNANGLAVNSAIDTLSVLRPGDVILNLGLNPGDGFFQPGNLKVQSATLSFNLGRENLMQLGSKYAVAKLPKFPIQATLQVSADVGEFQTGNLSQIVLNNYSYSPSVSIYAPGQAFVAGSVPNIYYQLVGAKLDNQNITESIGPNESVTMTFSCQIGGPAQTGVNVFMSGIIN